MQRRQNQFLGVCMCVVSQVIQRGCVEARSRPAGQVVSGGDNPLIVGHTTVDGQHLAQVLGVVSDPSLIDSPESPLVLNIDGHATAQTTPGQTCPIC